MRYADMRRRYHKLRRGRGETFRLWCVERNSFDKSQMISEFIDRDGQKVILVPRPRSTDCSRRSWRWLHSCTVGKLRAVSSSFFRRIKRGVRSVEQRVGGGVHARWFSNAYRYREGNRKTRR